LLEKYSIGAPTDGVVEYRAWQRGRRRIERPLSNRAAAAHSRVRLDRIDQNIRG
jgi:hypothetical protein